MLQSMRCQHRTAFLKALPHSYLPHLLQISVSLLTAFLFFHSLKHLQCIKKIHLRECKPKGKNGSGIEWMIQAREQMCHLKQ